MRVRLLKRVIAIAILARELARADRRLAAAAAGLIALTALLPVATTVVTGRLLGQLPGAIREHARFSDVLPVVGVLGLLFVVGQVTAAMQRPVFFMLGSRFTLHLRTMIEVATLSAAGLAHLEDPDCADQVSFVDGLERSNWPPAQIASGVASTLVGLIAGIGHAILLGQYIWWAPILLAVSFLPLRRWILRDVAVFVESAERSSPGLRRSTYLRGLATGDDSAKELRVFGVSEFVVKWFADTWQDVMRRLWRSRNAQRSLVVQAAVSQGLGYGLVFLAIANAGLRGRIGLGGVAIAAQAALGMMSMAYGGDGESAMRFGAPIVERVASLGRRLYIRGALLDGTRSSPKELTEGVVLREVHFTYPGTEQAVLNGVNLRIRAGESLAIVGLNGAGKTTLIKLLARLYDPTTGRILVDGVPLSDLAVRDWRAHLAVIFQDFCKYDLSLRDNVAFGAIELIEDDPSLTAALTEAGGAELLTRLGWETPLSPAYEGGVDLSGGEWQKVALARALAAVRAGARLLVLDEPTAHLDVRAEAELFDRFIDLTRGLTTILLSHRFSSVRKATRICVLDGGRVVEEGSHDQLMAFGGKYAEMFKLQAKHFGLAHA